MKNNKLIHLLLSFLIVSTILSSCKKDEVQTEPQIITNEVIESFRSETGINAVYVLDTSLLNSVIRWQGHGDYPGVDDWTTAKIPDNFDLLGGLPGQSEYYTINQTIIDTDTIKVDYWESLQVKENPQFGYRPMVGVFDITDTIKVAISKVMANTQYGDGGAWQIYVENYKEVLIIMDSIVLK